MKQELSEPLEGVAVIGMAGRFPGAGNIEQFWRNLRAGIESISRFSEAELAEAGVDVAAVRGDPRFVPAGAVLERPEWFDASFFGMSSKEAEITDPQQRLFLEVVWEAFEHGGYDPTCIALPCGVFAGMSPNTYRLQNLREDAESLRGVPPMMLLLGNERDFLATRVAYKLNLKGPAVNVSTACSTSLVAICEAVQSLLTYQCDIAVAGGAAVRFPQRTGYVYEEGAIASPDGHCRPFDAQAAGTVGGEGVAAVVLKRLTDAIDDGDHVYAVIKGAAVNNDGADKVSFTAPSVEGQAEVIAMAHGLAGVDPTTISYVEAHGTATPLGDPIEIAALTQAFGASGGRRQFCAIGSVKSNVGHLDAAAGVAGFIKTVLSLYHGELPPSLHYVKPNPKIDFARTPFYVNAVLADWPAGASPRRAGVSSFGLGGTNAHVVLEEAPRGPARATERRSELLVLSARSGPALERLTADLAAHLRERPDVDLADAAFTLQTGRAIFAHRRVAVCRDAADAAEVLAAGDPARLLSREPAADAPSAVFMFPGQGTQHVGMGSELYAAEPAFRAAFDRCAEALREDQGIDLRKIVHQGRECAQAREQLVRTELAQPALFAMELALAELWKSWGVAPTAMIGHSVGEYVAACLAGVLAVEDAVRLVAARGRLMQQQPLGAMLAVRRAESEILPLLTSETAIAAANGPSLCVVSGSFDAIDALERKLAEEGVWARRLETSHAFHSPLMDGVVEPFARLLETVQFGAPHTPYISNVTGRWVTAEQVGNVSYWCDHLRGTVRFGEGIRTLLEDPSRALLEVGPGQSLTQIARQVAGPAAARQVVASLPSMGRAPERDDLLGALGRMWLAGVPVDWNGCHGERRPRRIALPTYPFERKRYWIEPPRTEGRLAPPVAALEGAADAPAAAAPAPIATAPVAGRHTEVLQQITAMFSAIAGSDLSGADVDASFLELGFESLALTQVSQDLRRAFGVEITFRNLMEDLSSLRALADHIDRHLPEETASPPAAAPSALPFAATAPPATASSDVARGSHGHGPFRPLNSRTAADVTEAELAHVRALIERYTRRTAKSKEYTARHRPYLADPRSVSGFNRLWKEMVYPIVSVRSQGSKIWDLDGNEYVDFSMGFGANLLGHSPEVVVRAIEAQLRHGFEIGPQAALAGRVAALVHELTGNERTAFCNTGSEAVLAAMRMARTVTGREKIVTFAGDYHGVFDEVIVRGVGGGRAMPAAPGIPSSAADNMVVLEYGAAESLRAIEALGKSTAAVLVEPVQSRNLELQPWDFLRELKALTERTGAALVFDEVITGFRVHPGGMQALLDIRADLVTYGKIVGGGMPIGLVSGARRFMDALDGGMWSYGDDSFPEVGVTMFAGTFVRHPLALAAAEAVLLTLKDAGPGLQERLTAKVTEVAGELRQLIAAHDAPYELSHFASILYVMPRPGAKFASLLYYYLREKGIHAWENRAFVFTTAHSDEDYAWLVRAFRESLDEMRAAGLMGSGAESRPADAAPALPVVRHRADGVIEAPLTEMQSEVWLAAQLADGASLAYNDSFCVHLRGPLDVKALRDAVQTVVDRHDALRTTFAADGEAQYVVARRVQDLPVVDLSGLPAPERQRRWRELAVEQDATSFDLQKGPLLRTRLVKLEPDEHVLHLTGHHLVLDGWSWGVLIQELHALYCAQRTGGEPGLGPALQYHQYVAWLRKPERRAVDAAAERYWTQVLADRPAALELPADRRRSGERTFRAGSAEARFEPELYARLRRAAGRAGCTLSAYLLATFCAWLHRMTGREDVVVGMPAAGQATPGLGDVAGRERLIGHCVNMLPIRADVAAEMPFDAFLKALRTRLLDSFEHQDFTFSRLLRTLKFPRVADGMPFVSVTFNVDQAPGGGTLRMHDLDVRVEPVAKPGVFFDLVANVVDHQESADVVFTYAADLYSEAAVERWLAGWRLLLERCLDAPDTPVGALPVLPDRERGMVLHEWNRTAAEFPREHCLHEIVAEQAARTPNAVAVVAPDRRLTYRELDEAANRLAGALVERGARPGVLVGLCVERGADMVVGMLGILKSGAAYVPLDPAHPVERIRFVLDDAGAPLLVTQEKLEWDLGPLPGGVILLDRDAPDLARRGAEAPAATAGPRDLAYVIYTSGSTGRPKGVQIEHRAIVNFLCSMRREPGMSADDVLLAVTTPSFDIAGLEIYLPLVIGARVVIASSEAVADGGLLARELDEHEITIMQATPATYQLLLAAGWSGRARLKLLCGGEALPASLATQLLSRCGELWNMYGPTETTVWSTCARMTDAADLHIGRPIANTTTYVLDARLQPVPIGAVGELFIGGEGLARGYHNRPELTAEKFIEHPFEPGERLYGTGDLARYRPDANIECLGRVDFQVKLRGFRIELGEIEAELAQQPGVRQAVVIAREDAPGDKRLVAYVVAEGDAVPQGAELRAVLTARLPAYMVPSAFVVLEQLPLTPNGKIDRKVLPPPDDADIASVAEHVAPRNETEALVAQAFEEILAVAPVGAKHNFFDLGGHSFLAARLVARLRERLGVDLSIRVVFEAPTVERLAGYLDTVLWAAEREGDSASPAEERVTIEI